jgi:hypothetical protein
MIFNHRFRLSGYFNHLMIKRSFTVIKTPKLRLGVSGDSGFVAQLIPKVLWFLTNFLVYLSQAKADPTTFETV